MPKTPQQRTPGEPSQRAYVRAANITVTPTLTATTYDAGDVVANAIIEFENVVLDSGASAHVIAARMFDNDDQGVNADLYLFKSSVTAAAADAAHSLSDADSEELIDLVAFVTWEDHVNNQTSVVTLSPPLTVIPDGTSLYGILVTRGTPTYTASGVTLQLTVIQD